MLFDGSGKWHPISTAPFNRLLEVRIAGEHGTRRIPFPCRRDDSGWINADLGVRVEIDPIDWRVWPDGA